MSRDELKAKTLRGMSKRCVVACWLLNRFACGSVCCAHFGLTGMALGPQQPKAQGERTSRAGDERAHLRSVCVFAPRIGQRGAA